MVPSPRVAGNTSASRCPTPCPRRISQAVSDSGRTLSPVLVFSSRAGGSPLSPDFSAPDYGDG